MKTSPVLSLPGPECSVVRFAVGKRRFALGLWWVLSQDELCRMGWFLVGFFMLRYTSLETERCDLPDWSYYFRKCAALCLS